MLSRDKALLIQKWFIDGDSHSISLLWRRASQHPVWTERFFCYWLKLRDLPCPKGIATIYGAKEGQRRKCCCVRVDDSPMIYDITTGECFDIDEAFGTVDVPSLATIKKLCSKIKEGYGDGREKQRGLD